MVILELIDSVSLEIIVGTVAAITGIFLVAITWRYHNRSEEFKALMEVFKLLTERNHRLARETMYNRYRRFCKDGIDFHFEIDDLDKSTDMTYKEATGIVRSDFDQIGVLIYKTMSNDDLDTKNADKTWYGYRKGFLPQDIFFNMFSGAVVNSWYSLEHLINWERDNTRSKAFMLFFEKLARDAENYRKEHNLGKSEIEKLHEVQSKQEAEESKG